MNIDLFFYLSYHFFLFMNTESGLKKQNENIFLIQDLVLKKLLQPERKKITPETGSSEEKEKR